MTPPEHGGGVIGDRPSAGPGDLEEGFGRLAHLPVAIIEGRPQRRLDARIVEGGESDNRPSANGRLVARRRGEHRLESVGSTDRSQRGDRRLPTERIVVGGGREDRRKDGRVNVIGVLAGRPERGLGDRWILIADEGQDRRPRRSGEMFGDTAPDRRGPIGHRRRDVARVEGGEPFECADGGGADLGIGVGEGDAGGVDVASVTGENDLSMPVGVGGQVNSSWRNSAAPAAAPLRMAARASPMNAKMANRNARPKMRRQIGAPRFDGRPAAALRARWY